MSAIKVLNMAGAEVGTVELNDSIFGVEPNTAVVHEVVKNHLANCRQGTQSALTRAEVSGGGKKPWRQKGTGHARQGSTRAPQWTHGGIVFAPKPRSYSYVLNKKVKMGIRPEDIDDEPEFMAKHTDCQLEAQVEVSEMMGAEIYLYLEYKGNKMTARVAPTSKARNGDTVRVAFDPHKVHLFDVETEQTILN